MAVVVYPPKQSPANDNSFREYLSDCLTLVEAHFSNCALLVCDDFNRCDIKQLATLFRLKQIVKVPTRMGVTLDLTITNLHMHYCEPKEFPPFGLSNHATIAYPKTRVKNTKSTRSSTNKTCVDSIAAAA